MMRGLLGLTLLLVSLSFSLSAREIVLRGGTISVSLDEASGTYTIASGRIPWKFHGALGCRPTNLLQGHSRDHLGPYVEMTFRWSNPAPMQGSIRIYGKRDAVLFTETTVDSMDKAPTPFPVFQGIPAQLHLLTYTEREFGGPPVFGHVAIRDSLPERIHSGPVVLFDDSVRACILSPASDFMIAAILEPGQSSLASGLLSTLTGVPAGYAYKTLLVMNTGVNATWDAWGRFLTELYEKQRPSNEADAGLRYLGYWTDNGATYYYNYDTTKGYEGTLVAELEHLDSVKIPIRYLQLDSWWYLKGFTPPDGIPPEHPSSKTASLPAGAWNRYGGLLEYVPAPELFPHGLKSFHDRIRVPLITHNRWIEQDSPYRERYKISGIGAVDPRWWDKITSDIASWGVQTYEQDWQNYIYRYSPAFTTTTWAAEAFFDEMARACAKHGLTMQYCMSLPRCYLQGGAKYPNLTTIRVSGDRFERAKWKEFLYGSRLASALGIWPWADVFMSTERDNLLLATLSGGMVGIGDAYGTESPTNIAYAVRQDGVIVKPDAPIVPIDATVLADATNDAGSETAVTYTGRPGPDGTGRIFYVFSDNQGSASTSNRFHPEDVALHGDLFVYDFFSGTGRRLRATDPLPQVAPGATQYEIVAPVPPSGIAIIGDPGKFVTRGAQRIAGVVDRRHGCDVSVILAHAESSITLVGYSQTKPTVRAVGGKAALRGYDSASGQFQIAVMKERGTTMHRVHGDSIGTVEVQIRRTTGE